MTASCLYEGVVHHRRSEPRHEFRYSLFMAFVDLAELPWLFQGTALWSARRFSLAWFRRSDYLGDPGVPLDVAVRDLVRRSLGAAPTGPIRLLTNLRYFGYSFNPVSFYYLYGADGETVEAIVAELRNTPWNQRHCYVISRGKLASATEQPHEFTKSFHVSPFFDMAHEYKWLFSPPGTRLSVSMTNRQEGRDVFHASLSLRRTEMTPASLRRVLWQYPLMTLRVIAAIYTQAFRLHRKGATFYAHPDPGSRLLERSQS
jgi:DUF1365 family protein